MPSISLRFRPILRWASRCFSRCLGAKVFSRRRLLLQEALRLEEERKTEAAARQKALRLEEERKSEAAARQEALRLEEERKSEAAARQEALRLEAQRKAEAAARQEALRLEAQRKAEAGHHEGLSTNKTSDVDGILDALRRIAGRTTRDLSLINQIIELIQIWRDADAISLIRKHNPNAEVAQARIFEALHQREGDLASRQALELAQKFGLRHKNLKEQIKHRGYENVAQAIERDLASKSRSDSDSNSPSSTDKSTRPNPIQESPPNAYGVPTFAKTSLTATYTTYRLPDKDIASIESCKDRESLDGMLERLSASYGKDWDKVEKETVRRIENRRAEIEWLSLVRRNHTFSSALADTHAGEQAYTKATDQAEAKANEVRDDIEEEFRQLVEEIKPHNFTQSKQVSDYIVRHQLGRKYRHISGILKMEKNGIEWNFNGGISPNIFARLCRELDLHQQGSGALPGKFTPYIDIIND